MAVTLNRGYQLEQYRKDKFLTDVILTSEDVSLPCHKLILSLYSPYFRTMFQSSGFMESGQSHISMNHVNKDLLVIIVKFIYTGEIIITKDTAVDILEVVNLLQIEDQGQCLKKEITKVLISSVKNSVRFQDLFFIWNISVTYDLHQVVEIVLLEMEVKLESFLTNPEDLLWLGYLGWEELKQILQRSELCIESEAVLLKFVLDWAQDKVTSVEEFQNLQELLGCVRLGTLDKKFLRHQLCVRFPDYCDITTPLSISASNYFPRSCGNCHYIVQYKLTKTQIRNIEDFIDSGQKSMFLGFNLFNLKKQSSLKSLTNMSSMVGTAAGHYGRPVTSGSFLVQWRHIIMVIGGVTETCKDSTNSQKVTRPDILVYNAQKRCWVTSLKQFVKVKPGCRLHDVIKVNNTAYLMMTPLPNYSLPDGSVPEGYIESINLDTACQEYKVDRVLLSKIPDELASKEFGCVRVGNKIYAVGDGGAGIFNTETGVWSRLAPPIGSISSGRPVLAWCPPHVYLVSARLEDSTNVLQMLDTETGQWRRMPSLETRMTVLDLICHNGLLYLVGWQPARNNFVLALDRDSGETRVVLEGLQGVWTRGLVVRGTYFTDIINTSCYSMK